MASPSSDNLRSLCHMLRTVPDSEAHVQYLTCYAALNYSRRKSSMLSFDERGLIEIALLMFSGNGDASRHEVTPHRNPLTFVPYDSI